MPDRTDNQIRKAYRGYLDLYRSAPKDENPITEGLVDYIINVVGPKFSGFHQQCKIAYQYYQLNFDPVMPEGSRPVRLPTFRDRINTAMAQIMAGYVDISVPPKRITSRGVAERTEKFLHRARLMLERQSQTDEVMLIHMMLYGVAFKKVTFDLESLWKLPEVPNSTSKTVTRAYARAVDEAMDAQSNRFPMVARTINPTEMIWDMAGPDPRWMVWKTKRPMSLIQAYFPEWHTDDETSEHEMELYEIWTKNQVAFWCDNKWAMAPRTHEYGMIPILMAQPVLSINDENHRPQDRYRGLGHGVYELLEAESRMAGMFIDIAEKSAWPYYEVHGAPGPSAALMAEWSTAPNSMNHVPPNVDVVRGEVGEAPRSLLEGRQMLQDSINTSIFTSVASRRPENGPSSGYQTAVLQGIASLNLTPTMLAYKRVLEQQNELVLRTVEGVIRRSLSVAGTDMDGASIVSLSPDDINGYYANIVEINAMSPDEQERKAKLWSDMYRVGWVDHRYSLTQGGVQNPLSVMLAVQMEQIAKSDPMTAVLIQAAMSRIPYLQQQLDAVGLGNETENAENAFVDSVLATQGSTQLSNPGNFGAGNQAGNTPATPGGGSIPGTVRPNRPGSFEEQDLIARQISAGPGGRLA